LSDEGLLRARRSEAGATTELAFNPVPGRYDGNVDFATLGKQWTS